MRRVVAVLVACTPHAAAAAALVAREQSVLESGAPAAAPVDDVHQPFTTVLSSVHATLFNVTRDVETVEQSGPGSGPVSQLRQHTESALYEIEQVPRLCPHRPPRLRPFASSPRAAMVLNGLRHVAQGIESLRHVRRGVEASQRLSPPVKTQVHAAATPSFLGTLSRRRLTCAHDGAFQVLWDLDKMTEDVQRLHASGLAPNGRAALLKALQLRFAVLLSPSFWRAPVRRSLISR